MQWEGNGAARNREKIREVMVSGTIILAEREERHTKDMVSNRMPSSKLEPAVEVGGVLLECLCFAPGEIKASHDCHPPCVFFPVTCPHTVSLQGISAPSHLFFLMKIFPCTLGDGQLSVYNFLLFTFSFVSEGGRVSGM